MLEYEELRIRVREVGPRRYLVLANGPATAADIVTLDQDPDSYRAAFDHLIDVELGMAPQGQGNVTALLRKLGRDVYGALFSPRLAGCVSEALEHARAGGRDLRLRFDLPAGLAELPVEAITSPADQPGQALALGSYSVARTLRGSPPGARLLDAGSHPGPVHLLVAVAAQGGALGSIEVQDELDRLRERLRPEPAVRLEVIRDVTRGHLEQWLDKHADDPAAVLLMAHGWYDGDSGQGVVRLEGGEGDPVPGMVLGGMLTQARRLRLVVLSLCDGASSSRSEPFSGLAQALIGCGVPAVVAMRNRVTDTAAGLFTPDLLTAVAQNRTIDEAVRAARRHIAEIPGHTSVEWATPTLFLHEACHSGWLFKVTEVGDVDPADPLREGAEALNLLRNPGPRVSPQTLLSAARFLRAQGQWDDLLGVAQTRLRSGRPAELNRLRDEARAELAWAAAERLCALLAGNAGTDAAGALAGLGPGELADVLGREVAAAGRLSALVREGEQAAAREDWAAAADCFSQVLAQRPHGYLDARDRLAAAETNRELAALYAGCGADLAAGRWAAAIEACGQLLARRPDGYRDTARRRDYAAGRVAESRPDWTAAAAAYQSCQEYQDAPARLARARGHDFAAARQWARARDQFAAAAALGLSDEGWGDYCAGRLAEEDGDWAAAAAGYQRVAGSPGAPPDTAARRLLAEGRLAVAAADWPRALATLEDAGKSDGADPETAGAAEGLVRQAYESVRQQAEAAEEGDDWAAAARLFGLLAAGDPNAETRRAYALGRTAEGEGDWPAAAGFFAGIEYSDARLRQAYADGRRHELDGRWDDAAGCFAAAAPTADAERRRRYATGRLADERGDWPGVISGFGELGDDYAGGAVRSCRFYARARIAAGRDAWDEVTALLRGVGGGHRAADAAALRAVAAGWQARNSGRWADAAARFGELDQADEKLSQLRGYCAARARELSGDWPAALDAYAALPDGFEDAAARRAYARARLDELAAGDQAAWEAVAAAYAALPDGFEDATARARYAAIRRAEVTGDWRALLDQAARSDPAADPDLAVGAELRSYAAGRLAEDDEHWADAADAYGKIAGYRDATVRRWYAQGRAAEAGSLWGEADTAYQQSGGVRDAAVRGRRVRRLLTALPWAATLGRRELVADPSAAADPADPYQVLRPAGITPASPASEARQASFVLMKRFRKLTPEQRAASDELRLPARRMRHDALLYLLSDPDRLRAELAALAESAELADGDGPGLLAALCGRLPADAPLLTLFGGDRDGALAAWRQRLRAAPADMTAAHNLAVACLRKAVLLEENGAWEHARPTWEEALACWAAVLADDGHWSAWRQARAACYGQPVTDADVSRLRWDLARDLSERLSQYASRHAEHDRAQQAASYRELLLFLEIEQQGARALAECGGLPLPDGTVIACGLAYLRSAGLEERLARRVAELADTSPDGQGTGNAELRRLRSSFSELSAAFTLGTQHRFDQELQALRAFPRQPLGELPADCPGLAGDPGHQLADCPDCGDFLRRNPAYTLLPRRWRILQLDTVFHAVWAHLNIARTALTSGPDGQQAALAQLADAMEAARLGAMSVRTREAVTRMIIGRADSLYRAEGPRRGARLSEGIALVERGLEVAGDREKTRQELSAMLSDLLTSRGVWYSFDCRDHGIEPEYDKAEADQRRAFQCNPRSVNARNNLARRLVYNMSAGSPARWGPADLARIQDSLRLVHDGLLQTGRHSLLLETLGDILVMFEKYLGAHVTLTELMGMAAARDAATEDADETASDGNRGLWNLCVRIRRDPMNEQARAVLISALDDLTSPEGGAQPR